MHYAQCHQTDFTILIHLNRYYIYPHTSCSSSKPLILVPAIEVEALIYDINKGFGSSYTMPSSSREPGFLLNFDQKGSPRPRYLGRVNADISVEDMESKIPALGFKTVGAWAHLLLYPRLPNSNQSSMATQADFQLTNREVKPRCTKIALSQPSRRR